MAVSLARRAAAILLAAALLAVASHPAIAHTAAGRAATHGPETDLLAAARGQTPTLLQTPVRPTPLRVAGRAGDGLVIVSWLRSGFAGDSRLTGFEATASPGGATCSTSGALACALTGLVNDTAYTFSVVAHYSLGSSLASSASAAVTPLTVPDDNLGVVATGAEDGQSRITWQVPTNNTGLAITSYDVISDPDGHVCVHDDAATTACTITGLDNGTTYSFKVIARNEAGPFAESEWSASATPAGSPEPPINITATPASSGSLDVAWDAPIETGGLPITSYTATTVPGGHSCSSPATACTITGADRGRRYYVTVTAENQASRTSKPRNLIVGFSTLVEVPADPPGAPRSVATVSGNGDTRISWAAPADAGAHDATIVSYTATAVDLNSNDTHTCTAVGGGLACIITGLTNGVYNATVTAHSSYALTSEPSSTTTFLVPGAATGAPEAPTGVTAAVQGDTATVSWTPPTGSVTGYEVHAKPGPGLCTVAAGETSCDITGLTPGESYSFAAVALNDAGRSPASQPSAPAAVPTAPPGAPRAVTVTAAPAGGWALMHWDAPETDGGATITGYTATAAPSGRACTARGTDRWCRIEGLAHGAYTFIVTASNSWGASPPSQPITEWVTAPTGVRAEPGAPDAGEVIVTWTAPTPPGASFTIDGYTVKSTPGQRTCTAAGSDTTCTVTGLVHNRNYTFTVTAERSDGHQTTSAPSKATTPAEVVTQQRPTTPTGGGGGGGGGGAGGAGGGGGQPDPVLEIEGPPLRQPTQSLSSPPLSPTAAVSAQRAG